MLSASCCQDLWDMASTENRASNDSGTRQTESTISFKGMNQWWSRTQRPSTTWKRQVDYCYCLFAWNQVATHDLAVAMIHALAPVMMTMTIWPWSGISSCDSSLPTESIMHQPCLLDWMKRPMAKIRIRSQVGCTWECIGCQDEDLRALRRPSVRVQFSNHRSP